MAAPSFNAGTLVTVTATFEAISGTPTDPSAISLKYRVVGEAITTWTYLGAGSITRTGTGVYVAELDTTSLAGAWIGEWIGTGACQVTQPFTFMVVPLPI